MFFCEQTFSVCWSHWDTEECCTVIVLPIAVPVAAWPTCSGECTVLIIGPAIGAVVCMTVFEFDAFLALEFRPCLGVALGGSGVGAVGVWYTSFDVSVSIVLWRRGLSSKHAGESPFSDRWTTDKTPYFRTTIFSVRIMIDWLLYGTSAHKGY